MNYIITKNKDFFNKIGNYNFCSLEDMILPEKIAVDTETTGLFARNCEIFCIQIGTGSNNYIIQLYDNNYEFKDVIPFIENKTMVFHNALFDLGFMYKYNFYPEKVLDTMLANKILYNGMKRVYYTKYNNTVMLPVKSDFGSVMNHELGIKYDKTDQKNIHIVKLSQDSAIQYSFNDVDKLLELHDALESKIEKEGFKNTYNLHCEYIKALAYMEQCGLPIKPELWKEKMIQDEANSLKWKNIIEEYIFDNLENFRNNQLDLFQVKKEIIVSINSPKQMLKVFNELGIKTKDKDGKDSISENIITKTKHEFVDIWLNYQEANHRVTTFGDSIYNKIENNRIYTNFNPMVDTSRLSTRRGNINFLNFPSDKITRSCFEANEGNVMVVSDWSGQETVIAADLSGDKAMTKSVVEGADLHSLLARVLFPEIKDLSDEEIVNNHKEKRTAAKAPRFAMSYGGNAYTLHMNEGIPLTRANEIETGFKELHEGLYTWGAKEFQKAVDTGFIKSADGWVLHLPEYDDYLRHKKVVNDMSRDDWSLYKQGKQENQKYYDAKEEGLVYKIKLQKAYDFYLSKKRDVRHYFIIKAKYERLCLNNPVQSYGAHQLKKATSDLFKWIKENNYLNKVKICNTVHDEIVLECEESLQNIVKDTLQRTMINAGNHYLVNLKIKADANVGASWEEAK